MTKRDRLIRNILSGTADANIAFADLCGLLAALGFGERVKGDHHMFTKNDVEEIINLQPRGNMAKPYQVRQVRGLLVRYKLGEIDV
jgi:hypothetical protein